MTLLLALTAFGCSSGEDTEATCAEEYAPFHCVRKGCGGDVVNAPTCQDGAWVCAAGWVHPDTCPDDACFHTPVACCDASGYHSMATCPGQTSEVCPAGTYKSGYGSCPPAGTFMCDATNCVLGAEYCRNASSTSTCEPLPGDCGDKPSCSCLKSIDCGTCYDAGIGALRMNCD